jgi:hypothetical protein
VLALSACTTTGTGRRFVQPDAVPESVAAIYVFRLSSFVGSVYTARFEIDGKPLGNLGNGSYFVRHVPPGKHQIKMKKTFLETGAEHELEIDTQAGQTYYVQYFLNPPTPGVADNMFVVSEKNALILLEGLKEVE